MCPLREVSCGLRCPEQAAARQSTVIRRKVLVGQDRTDVGCFELLRIGYARSWVWAKSLGIGHASPKLYFHLGLEPDDAGFQVFFFCLLAKSCDGKAKQRERVTVKPNQWIVVESDRSVKGGEPRSRGRNRIDVDDVKVQEVAVADH